MPPDNDPSSKNRGTPIKTLLGVLTGLSLAIGLAPVVTWTYFRVQGWPRPSVTHTGPLWGTGYGGLLFQGNYLLLFVLPLASLALGMAYIRARAKDRLVYLWLAVPLAQAACGVVNCALLLRLLD